MIKIIGKEVSEWEYKLFDTFINYLKEYYSIPNNFDITIKILKPSKSKSFGGISSKNHIIEVEDSFPQLFLQHILHEFIHLKQFYKNELEVDGEYIYYKGKKSISYEDYKTLDYNSHSNLEFERESNDKKAYNDFLKSKELKDLSNSDANIQYIFESKENNMKIKELDISSGIEADVPENQGDEEKKKKVIDNMEISESKKLYKIKIKKSMMIENIYIKKNSYIYILQENLNKDLKLASSKLGIKPNEIFVHATTLDGLKDIYEEYNRGEYISVSSFQGSSKFLEKYGENIFVILQATEKDVDFREWGDVGWKGGTPKKTSYDEIGLTGWKLKGLYIPEYYKNNWSYAIRTLIAKEYYYYNFSNGDYIDIITQNNNIINKAENYIQEKWDEEFGNNIPDEYAMEDFYSNILKEN